MRKNYTKKAISQNQTSLNEFMKPKLNTSEKPNKITPMLKVPVSSGSDPELKFCFDKFIYPQNPQFRDYQYEICLKCVFYNTLVCLPTGLGKTHIASVLMVNFARWFQDGKILFLAPTRPLVNQQKASLENFYDVIGNGKVAQMNGQIPAKKRSVFYQERKIFFATPQTFQNDLRERRIDGKKIVLIIVDEAHRSTGNYSYCKIAELMRGYGIGYRMVGLSATPGNQVQKIQEVITKLQIAKLEVRDLDDPDVAKYLFTKDIQEVKIKATSIINDIEKMLLEFTQQPIKLLLSVKAIDPYVLKFQSFWMIFTSFQKRMQEHQFTVSQKAIAYNALKVLRFLFDSRKALKQQGYQTFKNKFLTHFQDNPSQISEGSKASKKSKSSMKSKSNSNGFLNKIKNSEQLQKIKKLLEKDSFSAVNHPKLEHLKKLIEEFFQYQEGQKGKKKDSKVIIFVQYRATALEIKNYLNDSKVVMAELFHGQSRSRVANYSRTQQISLNGQSSVEYHLNEDTCSMTQVAKQHAKVAKTEDKQQQSKPNESYTVMHMDQKRQMEIVKKFREGRINTLIATSIGEEGLDIGEVDCIFCYDGGMSPIRMIQRMGRTGRKRDGRVYVMLMEGKEYNGYLKAQQKSKQMKIILKKQANKFTYYSFNSTLFPQLTEIPVQIYDNYMHHPDIPSANDESEVQDQISQNQFKSKQFSTKFDYPQKKTKKRSSLTRNKKNAQTKATRKTLKQKTNHPVFAEDQIQSEIISPIRFIGQRQENYLLNFESSEETVSLQGSSQFSGFSERQDSNDEVQNKVQSKNQPIAESKLENSDQQEFDSDQAAENEHLFDDLPSGVTSKVYHN